MELSMLTNSHVVLTIYDPIENRVTNFTSTKDIEVQIQRKDLVEERFVIDDVSYFYFFPQQFF